MNIKWTHILAVLEVETYIHSSDLASEVEDYLKDAPKITGENNDAKIFVNARCKWNPETSKFDDDCYETRAVITVVGDLQDRTVKQTRDEWNTFCRYLERFPEFDIHRVACKIAHNYVG